MCRKTSIFDWPIVALAYFIASLNSATGRLRLPIAAANASMTVLSSRTVVPAISRQMTEKRLTMTSGGNRGPRAGEESGAPRGVADILQS